ncbi:uncharacterized protein LY89DRAFT_784731 [Mollisia scopiformis]|uniref:Zn(2)-C6 fungal-type domain-containing protein n=1 Tax=Mollisia scopiformis TaxID=149040 RepID=A0A194X215_MOLSC|nr:uncharacterized protein LY89DRAFT_784731 [Mollisia scopiformis]KUJ13887.1 hypothetical protein LY89DRAFT_784731 [Mollisia scopiformis]
MASRPAKTLTRANITACLRCRRKKQKCDQGLPSCGPCQKANVECVGYDAVTQRPAPRSYIHSLEERIASLEIRLRNHGIDCDADTPRTSPNLNSSPSRQISTTSTQRSSQADVVSNQNLETILSKSAQVTVESLSDNLHVGSNNGTSFTRLFLSELQWDQEQATTVSGTADSSAVEENMEYVTFEAPRTLDSGPIALPSKKVAEHLATVYFELANFSLPILHEPTFRTYLAAAYTSQEPQTQVNGRKSRRHELFSFLVFAVALLTLHKTDSNSVSISTCESYHRSALQCLAEVGLYVNIESVQILLLLANYSYLHPSFVSTWNLMGMAARLAIKQGLHKEPSKISSMHWSLISEEESFGFPDGAITTEFLATEKDEAITEDGINIDPSNTSKKVFALHYFRYRQLQSEIQTVLHEKVPSYITIDYSQWQTAMLKRLSDWHNSTPRNTSQSYIAPPEALEISYYTAEILLLRPSPTIPSPSDTTLCHLAQASSRTIHLYRTSVKEKKLRLFWQAAHNLFAAGTAILYCYSHSKPVRDQIPIRNLVADVNACAAVLWAVVEKFPAAKGTRDAFDAIMDRALAQLHNDTACDQQYGMSGAVELPRRGSGQQAPNVHSLFSPTENVPNNAMFGSDLSGSQISQPFQNFWRGMDADASMAGGMNMDTDTMMGSGQWLPDSQELTSFYVDLH